MSRRVLVASYVPPGHLFGPLSVALTLRDNGFDVQYWTPSYGHAVVGGTGLQTVHKGLWEGRSGGRPAERADDPVAGVVAGLVASYADRLEDQLAEFAAVLDETRPDVVVCGATVLGLLLETERRGIPCLALTPGIYYPVGDDIPPPLTGLPIGGRRRPAEEDDVRARWARAERPVCERIAGTRTRLGLPDRNGGLLAQLTSADTTLVPSSPLLEGDRIGVPDAVRYVGECVSVAARACALGPASEPLPDFTRPLALVTSGTNPKTDLVVQGTHELLAAGFAVVALTWSVDVAWLPESPHLCVRSYLPMTDALERAAVVVTNGGSGGVMQALAAGVPLVARPDGADQADNAVRVEAAGAGVVCASGDDLGAAARAVVDDPGPRVSAAALADDITRRGGPVGVARLVIDLLIATGSR